MLLVIRLISFAVVAFLIQQNGLAADCPDLDPKIANILADPLGAPYPNRRISRAHTDGLKNFLAAGNHNDVDNNNGVAAPTPTTPGETTHVESTYSLTFAKKMYDAYLQDHRKNIDSILHMKAIAKANIPKIERVVAKAVRDLCADDSTRFTSSPIGRKTVKLPKQLALYNLKRLLDHLAVCHELDYGISKDTQEDLRKILEKASPALVSCDSYSPDFEIADVNRYSSPTTPRLHLGKRNSSDNEEMPAELKRIVEKSANPVKQVVFAEVGVAAFSKSCLEKSPYAEPENKRFGGINEKWVSLFSARHKHQLDFHVPAVIIDGKKQEFSATPEGTTSLMAAQSDDDVIKSISTESVHKYFVLSLLFNFSDSHLGNIRVGKNLFDRHYLISIDHGEALQVFYENPGTASLRFGHFLALFFEQAQKPMHHRIRQFLMDLDPKTEVEFARTQLMSEVETLAQTMKDENTEHFFNRKLDHFRLNLEFLKALAAQPESTFLDAFELRRGQFRVNIYREGEYRRRVRYMRNLFIKESLFQRTVSILQTTTSESAVKEHLLNESFRQFEPSCESLLNGKDREQITVFELSKETKTAIDLRLDDSFYQALATMFSKVMFPHIRSTYFHRMTPKELTAYQDIGF